MKENLQNNLLILALSVFAYSAPLQAADTSPVKVGVVNFKTCVEESKMGKNEQKTFESMKDQMEKALVEKEKGLTAIGSKLQDSDYVDSISTEAETELKHKFRVMNQELSQVQNQYMQALQQANMQIIQKLHDTIQKAAQKVAKDQKIGLVVNQDSIFFAEDKLNISKDVVVEMDKLYEKDIEELKKATEKKDKK